MNYGDVFNVWEAIRRTVQAHMEDCHRLIKDTAAQRGRLTLQSYSHTFQPEGWEVEPQWGISIWNPRAPHTMEMIVNASLTQWQKWGHKHFNYLGMEHIPQPSHVWHHEAHATSHPLNLILSCTFLCIHYKEGHSEAENNEPFRQKVAIQKLQNFSFQK